MQKEKACILSSWNLCSPVCDMEKTPLRRSSLSSKWPGRNWLRYSPSLKRILNWTTSMTHCWQSTLQGETLQGLDDWNDRICAVFSNCLFLPGRAFQPSKFLPGECSTSRYCVHWFQMSSWPPCCLWKATGDLPCALGPWWVLSPMEDALTSGSWVGI